MTSPPPAPPATLQGLRLRENQLFLALTVVVGILAGLSAVLFSLAIDGVGRVFFGLDPSPQRVFLVPTLASLVSGVLLHFVFPDARGSGVPQTKAAFHRQGGVIPLRVPIGKFIMGVLCVGSGHSMGREGPSVQIGAGVASAVGRWIGLSPRRTREIVAVGVAGALAAAFNTPVAAVIFTLEEIIGDLNAPLIGSTVVASVASVIVARSILGNEPLFSVPTYQLVHPAELGAYAALGVLGGLLSLAFCKALLGLRRRSLTLTPARRVLLPALGGALVGGMLIFVPQVMGVGYQYVDQALNGGLALEMLALLCLAKLVATVISYTTGNAGGVFAPSLYIGAMAGGVVGTVVAQVAPFPTADAGAYALVGMGAVFAGIIRAPMTSVFMIFEITQNYQILVPLMVANLLSYSISRHYQPVPLYHALLAQDGIHVPSAPLADPRPGWTAADVMRTDAPHLTSDDSVAAAALATREIDHAVLVTHDGALLGVVTAAQIARARLEGRDAMRVADVMDGAGTVVEADEIDAVVMARLAAGSSPVAVVEIGGTRVCGTITAADVVRFLGREATPRADR